ncbi:MAG: hypothetical protein LH606_02990 [Cytophagaceae bacterium]|nr:hypothetical protein [Cytophagaceae bacterium]
MKKPLLYLPGLLGIATILLFSTCKKDDGLPHETQEGANTFGCKVNGKAWIPNGGPGFMGAKPIEGGFRSVYNQFNDDKNLGVYIRAHMRNGEYINLYLRRSEVGRYQLNKQTQIRPFYFYPENYGAFQSDGYFVTNPQATG